jgi:hypothetical protein
MMGTPAHSWLLEVEFMRDLLSCFSDLRAFCRFSLGDPQPAGPGIAVALTRVIPGVWTHVATSWDGSEVRLYVNGLLSAVAVWDRSFSEARSHSRFRIGYTGNGAGALRFDLGEAAVFTRALPAPDIWKLAMRPMAEQQPAIIAAREALAKGDPQQALLLLEQLSDDGPLSQEKLFTMGEAFREQQNWDQSLVFFQRLTADPHDSPLRATALYEEAALLAGDRRPAVFQKRSTRMMDSVSVADVNASPESVTWVRQHLEERQQTARADSLKRRVYRCGEATSCATLRGLSSLFRVAASLSGRSSGCQQCVEVG